jgi:tRNA G18 (ribose-2'-O)-methylase SpoU
MTAGGERDMRFRARRCTSDRCSLRFPVEDGSALGSSCPRCGAPTEWLDESWSTHRAPADVPTAAVRLAALLDNLRSVRNVGSILRTADGVGLAHLHFGGVTPTPDHPRIAKTALGAEMSVAWSAHADAAAAAATLRDSGHRLWALEGGPGATSLFDPAVQAGVRTDARPLVLVLGHEVSGIDPRIVALCERTLYIPMLGIKGSLNVSVAFGIAAYVLRFGAV